MFWGPKGYSRSMLRSCAPRITFVKRRAPDSEIGDTFAGNPSVHFAGSAPCGLVWCRFQPPIPWKISNGSCWYRGGEEPVSRWLMRARGAPTLEPPRARKHIGRLRTFRTAIGEFVSQRLSVEGLVSRTGQRTRPGKGTLRVSGMLRGNVTAARRLEACGQDLAHPIQECWSNAPSDVLRRATCVPPRRREAFRMPPASPVLPGDEAGFSILPPADFPIYGNVL